MTPDLSGGDRALALIEQVLVARPEKDDAALAACAQELCVYRDALILRARETSTSKARERLAQVNAVLSIVLAVHFPIGAVPWGELEKAKAWLSHLLVEHGDEVTAA